jgi:hypothetical protein
MATASNTNTGKVIPVSVIATIGTQAHSIGMDKPQIQIVVCQRMSDLRLFEIRSLAVSMRSFIIAISNLTKSMVLNPSKPPPAQAAVNYQLSTVRRFIEVIPIDPYTHDRNNHREPQ